MVSDLELLEAVLAGDPEAYRPLVDRHTAMLFRVAYRISGNAGDAEEIVQEAFLRAYQQLPRFEKRSDFSTWIYRITVNCSLNGLKKRKKEKAVQPAGERQDQEIADSFATPERLAFSSQIGRLRDSAMRTLSEVERTAFILRHMEVRSMDEVACTLGMNVNAAKNAVFRGVQKMRRALEPVWMKQ